MPAKPSKTDIGSSTVASWATLASKYQDEGRYREAIRLYLKTLELEPTRSVETTLGALYELLGETAQALAEHHRAIRKNPGDPASHAGLAGLLRRLGKAEEARLAVAEARNKIDPHTCHYTLACIHAISGNSCQALIHLARGLDESPADNQWSQRDPDFITLNDRPGFKRIVGETKDR